MKLRRTSFRLVEDELYSYHDTKKEIESIRSDILHRTPHVDNPEASRSGTSDPTGQMVTALIMNRRLIYLERIVNSIEQVYESLPEEKQRLIKLKYWVKPQTKTWEGIAQELNISRRQALRWRDDIIHLIADLIGLR